MSPPSSPRTRDRYLRTLADAENARRRSEQQAESNGQEKSFGPEASLASLSKGSIVCLEKSFLVEEDGERAAVEQDP